MKPETVGRVLGIGLRVAGRVAGQRIGAVSAQAAPTSPPRVQASSSAPDSAAKIHRSGGSLAQGIGGFFRPFRRIGGVLWLEVTGVFFLLPVVVFAPTLWRTRASFAHGPDHRSFVSAAIVAAIFFYLGVSSFWRARRRSSSRPGSNSK
jgi:hypothetical protein